MRKVLSAVFLTAAPVLSACGGSGGDDAATLPFRFQWTATVSAIEDGNGAPAAVPGVAVAATLVATVAYDPALFADGVSIGDGRDYAAPAGTLMTYAFSSGGQFTKQVTAARVRDGGAFDQFNWNGGDFGGLLLQVNDPSDASVTLPLVVQFATVHADFVQDQASFQTTGNERLEFPNANPANARVIRFSGAAFQVLAN